MWLDGLLAIGAAFDWITPLRDLCRDVTNAPTHDFAVSRRAGWSGGGVRRALKRHGITAWGLSYTSDSITFRVRQSQARRAQIIMRQNDIPILGGTLPDAPHQRG